MSGPVPFSAAIAEFLLQQSDERDAWYKRLRDESRLMYELGRTTGIAEGREAEARERDRAWNAIARPIAAGGITHAELEQRRWGPGGREHFGDPRPGDRLGAACPTWE